MYLDDLSIDLIDSINPFQNAYEVMSKNITPRLLKAINNIIQSQKVEMTDYDWLWLRLSDTSNKLLSTCSSLVDSCWSFKASGLLLLTGAG